MINNDTLRRLRYALTLNDNKVVAIFKLAGMDIPPYHLANIMRKEDEDGFVLCQNDVLVAFLDGLIIHLRGKQEGREPQPWPRGQYLSNNEVLRKIRIALELKGQNIIEIMSLAGFKVSKSELSALFRKADHRNYKECGNQFLRNFITGLTMRNRKDTSVANPAEPVVNQSETGKAGTGKTGIGKTESGDSEAGKSEKPAAIDPWKKSR